MSQDTIPQHERAAFEKWCETAIAALDLALQGTGQKTPAETLPLLQAHDRWIAQEQVKAYKHGATAFEFGKWAAAQILDYLRRQS